MLRTTDLVCLSHLRWNFVFQRPNHLMSRAARDYRVFFVEEPYFDAARSHSVVREVEPNLFVVTPWLRHGLSGEQIAIEQRRILGERLVQAKVERPVHWYYTPMALAFASSMPASLVVYDCMDELSAFQGAPAALRDYEKQLFARADLVFTGGASLYREKRKAHSDVHLFPSSVDVGHFREARLELAEPLDQVALPRPRLGFFGVIDERMDLELLDALAVARPNYQIIMVGPVVKIDPAALPRRPNIHYLGQKSYADLPRYLRGWDVALMPFAQNEATRFISPTKTLEYLAGGKNVVSTPIRDVVSPYAEQGIVRVAEPRDFAAAVDAALAEGTTEAQRARSSALLARTSWDNTWSEMASLMAAKLTARESRAS